MDASFNVIGKLKQRLLVPWLALLCFPVALGADALYSHGWDGSFGSGFNIPLIVSAVCAFAAVIGVLRRGIGRGLGQRFGMVDLSKFAKLCGIEINSSKDLDALRSAIDATAPNVIAWLLVETAFATAAVLWREPQDRAITSAATLLILLLTRA